MSGSGKSNALTSYIIAMRTVNPECEIEIFDIKREFSLLEGMQDIVVFTEPAAIVYRLQALLAEIKKRMAIITKEKCRNYEDLIDQKKSTDLHPKIVVIDELAALNHYLQASGDKEMKNFVKHTLPNIFLLARSAGIALWISAQKPLAEVIGSENRGQVIPIIFKLQQPRDARLVLDSSDSGVEDLQGKGEGI